MKALAFFQTPVEDIQVFAGAVPGAVPGGGGFETGLDAIGHMAQHHGGPLLPVVFNEGFHRTCAVFHGFGYGSHRQLVPQLVAAQVFQTGWDAEQ